MPDETKLADGWPEELWCEEGGFRLRIERGEKGGAILSVVDVTPGWPGEVTAAVTVANFRIPRVIEALSVVAAS